MKDQNKIIIERFNQLAIDYRQNHVAQSGYLVEKQPISEQIFDNWIDYIQKYFKVESHHLLLDAGCGSGLFLKRLKLFTKHLWAVEPADELLTIAKRLNPGVKFSNSRVGNVIFKNIKFDRLFCNSVLFYLNSMKDGEKAIQHFFNITSESAKIWLGDIPMPNPELCDRDYRRIEKSSGWKLQHYPPQFFYKICDKRNYECKILYQEVDGKITAAFRYDVLISK